MQVPGVQHRAGDDGGEHPCCQQPGRPVALHGVWRDRDRGHVREQQYGLYPLGQLERGKVRLGTTPGNPKTHLGGLLGCQASTDGKSALISGEQIVVGKTANSTLHTDVTTSHGDQLPFVTLWR